VRRRSIDLEDGFCCEFRLERLHQPRNEQANAASPEHEPFSDKPHDVGTGGIERLNDDGRRREHKQEKNDGDIIHICTASMGRAPLAGSAMKPAFSHSWLGR